MNILSKKGTRLLVCDMAGTVVQENGAVYIALANSLRKVKCKVNDGDIQEWHGRSKDEVLLDALYSQYTPIVAHDKYIEALDLFDHELHTQYFTNHRLSLIDPDIPTFFNSLRQKGIKVALNTGYSQIMQNNIIDYLNLGSCIDSFISSDDVKRGRPYPSMIHHLMEKTDTLDVKSVVKVGDTIIDMLEGKNAGCGATIGVLSGAVERNDLLASGTADYIVEKITDIS